MKWFALQINQPKREKLIKMKILKVFALGFMLSGPVIAGDLIINSMHSDPTVKTAFEQLLEGFKKVQSPAVRAQQRAGGDPDREDSFRWIQKNSGQTLFQVDSERFSSRQAEQKEIQAKRRFIRTGSDNFGKIQTYLGETQTSPDSCG